MEEELRLREEQLNQLRRDIEYQRAQEQEVQETPERKQANLEGSPVQT